MPNKTPVSIYGHQQQQQQLGRSSPYGLLQSARRRLQCSQLPVRNVSARQQQQQQQHHHHQQQQQQQGCRLVSSLKKFPVLGTPARGERVSGGARKSLSMVDLSPGPDYDRCNDRRQPSVEKNCKPTGRSEESDDLSSGDELAVRIGVLPSTKWLRESQAASVICRSLAINSWRRRREEVVDLRSSKDNLEQTLEHFKIQIVVLRRLLDNENSRVAKLAGELHRSRAQVEDLAKERDCLKLGKEAAEGEMQGYREIADDRLVTVENLRNELRSLQDQVQLLDKQIEKDREKLLKLTEDKKVLLEKVSTSEAQATARGDRADKAESSLEEIKTQLAAQIATTYSLREEVLLTSKKLKENEDQKSELKETLNKLQKDNEVVRERFRLSEEMALALSRRTTEMEKLRFEQESKIVQFETTCNAQLIEINELRERIIRETQESGWSSRFIKFAGNVVRVPQMIIRTLSFFTIGVPVIF